MPRKTTELASELAPRSDTTDPLQALEALKRIAGDAEAAVQSAQAIYEQSARWHASAERELGAYLMAREAGAEVDDPARLADLRDRVTDLAATRVVRDQVGSTTRYADRRALHALQEAQDGHQEALSDIVRYAQQHRGALQRAMLARSEEAREDLLESFGDASRAIAKWRRVRTEWLELGERWGISPAETPPLPVTDPYQALQDGLAHQQRAGGHVRHPRLLTPAPLSVQLADPADARIETVGDAVPDTQRAA